MVSRTSNPSQQNHDNPNQHLHEEINKWFHPCHIYTPVKYVDLGQNSGLKLQRKKFTIEIGQFRLRSVLFQRNTSKSYTGFIWSISWIMAFYPSFFLTFSKEKFKAVKWEYRSVILMPLQWFCIQSQFDVWGSFYLIHL